MMKFYALKVRSLKQKLSAGRNLLTPVLQQPTEPYQRKSRRNSLRKRESLWTQWNFAKNWLAIVNRICTDYLNFYKTSLTCSILPTPNVHAALGYIHSIQWIGFASDYKAWTSDDGERWTLRFITFINI